MPPRPSPPTHFLCIPLSTVTGRRQLSASLSTFKLDVTSPDSFGIPEQAVRPVGTLHLTLGVMSFPENEGLEKAVKLLRSIEPRKLLADHLAGASSSVPVSLGQLPAAAAAAAAAAVAKPGAGGPQAENPAGSSAELLLSVSLRGLHAMQSAATCSKSSVLYAAPTDTDGVLMGFCEKLRSVFREAGLMVGDTRPLLLHATVLNTIYVKETGGRRRKYGEKLMIDAQPILDRYDDYVWMENVPVEKIAICKMGAKKLDDGDEAYEVEAEIDVV